MIRRSAVVLGVLLTVAGLAQEAAAQKVCDPYTPREAQPGCVVGQFGAPPSGGTAPAPAPAPARSPAPAPAPQPQPQQPTPAAKLCDPYTPRHLQPGCVDGQFGAPPTASPLGAAVPAPPANRDRVKQAPIAEAAAHSAECTPAAAAMALEAVFRQELQAHPALALLFRDPHSRPVEEALIVCRKLNSVRDLQRWMSLPQNKKMYWESFGIASAAQAAADADRAHAESEAAKKAADAQAAKRAECTPEAAGAVLKAVFHAELWTHRSLATTFSDPQSQPVKAALADCQTGREGGGRNGLHRWIAKPENKKWYWENAGIAQAVQLAAEASRATAEQELAKATHLGRLAECRPSAAAAALFAAFDKELALYPSLEAMFRDSGSAAVQAAIADCLAGREGGGRDGLRAWISKQETKKHYWSTHGFLVHVLNNECKASDVQHAFRKLFQQETARSPALKAYFEDDRSQLVSDVREVCSANVQRGFAVGLSNLSHPKVKEWYWSSYLAKVVKMDECNASAAKDVLHTVFATELKSYPVIARVFADAHSQPVKAAIGDCLAGREGGGRDGMHQWLSKAEVKRYYWDHMGLSGIARQADEQARQRVAEEAARKRRETCSQGLYVIDGTNNGAHQNTLMFHLYTWAQAQPDCTLVKRYIAGIGDAVAWLGLETGAGVDDVWRDAIQLICGDAAGRPGLPPVQSIGVIGFSRGAMVALSVVNHLGKKGCPGSNRSLADRITFVGFDDPVRTSMAPWWPDNLEVEVPHRTQIVKSQYNSGAFKRIALWTHVIGNVPDTVQVPDMEHGDMNCLSMLVVAGQMRYVQPVANAPLVEEHLVDRAQRAGFSFKPAPRTRLGSCPEVDRGSYDRKVEVVKSW